jgi:hypothetical protein
MPNDQAPPNGPAASSGKVTRGSAYARSQLDDALALSGYAVSAGVHTPSGDPLPFADIGVIQGTAAKLGLFDPPFPRLDRASGAVRCGGAPGCCWLVLA